MLPLSGSIVIVEDYPLLRPITAEILEGTGAKVESFASADDALMHMLALDDEFALVISGHSIPGQIQGAELAAMI